jgi:hypothetical protein
MAVMEATILRRFDPDSRYQAPRGAMFNPDGDRPVHVLDNPDNRARFLKLWTWWNEGRDGHFRSRAMRLRDHEFYDGRHWTDNEIAALEERGQAALVFNAIKQTVDWIVGTERRTRVDWNVLPRNEEDVEGATLKKELMKYVSDVNKLGWQRSFAFKDAVISGLGIVEECRVTARNAEPCASRYVDWKQFWWDPHSRDHMWDDCRWQLRAKYLDLDYACSMFKDRADLLRACAQTNMDPGLELVDDDAMMSSLYVGTRSLLAGSVALILGTARQRIRIFEMWYREPVDYQFLENNYGDTSDPLHDIRYDPENMDHQAAIDGGMVSLTDGVTDEMRLAFMCEGGLLSDELSPYKHGQFPFTPYWAFRDHLSGMPYGVVRQAIDPQLDYNKRRSKALHLLLVNRVLYEEGAIKEADEENSLIEAGRPDGQVRLAKNALAEGRFKIEEHADMMQGHVRLMEEDKENIHEATGVTRDNVGQQSNAISGRAILAKQQQGAVTTAEIFDNYRLGIQLSGEKQLSNIEQYMTLPKQFRILGQDGEATWRRINQPTINPETGGIEFTNDITKTAADFIVDQQDYRETIRMALAESLFELIGRLPPEMAVNLLDLAVDLVDIPNKAAVINRIRQINGQLAPGQEQTPEAQAARQQVQAKKDEAQQLVIDEQKANIRHKNAQAGKAESDTTRGNIQGKREALDTAGIVSAAIPLAPAADRLYEGSKPTLQVPASFAAQQNMGQSALQASQHSAQPPPPPHEVPAP